MLIISYQRGVPWSLLSCAWSLFDKIRIRALVQQVPDIVLCDTSSWTRFADMSGGELVFERLCEFVNTYN